MIMPSRKRFIHIVLFTSALLCSCSHAPQPVTAPTHSATYTQYAIACDHEVASQAGEKMLAAGGNAVDAAVAASFCLSVVRPFSCGIGGGGFMVISLPPSSTHLERRSVALDYREACPAAVGPVYFENLPKESSRLGVHSSGVPGSVAGLLYALEKFGTLDRATVLAPAIKAAREGFAADASLLGAVETMRDAWHEHPYLRPHLVAAWDRFARRDKIAVGDIIVNEPQALALELIAQHGAEAFYAGPIAEAILEVMEDGNGPITQADLAAYEVRERPALESRQGPWNIVSMPPPSSGGIATQQVFGLLKRLDALTGEFEQDSPLWRHLLIESFKHAFADRARWLADDAFSPVPVTRLTSAAYLDSLAARVNPIGTQPPEAYGSAPQLPGDSGTSHVSVLDADGMAVGCSETINLHWGSCVEVPGFGFFLNDEMDDFTTSDGANAYGLVQSDRNRPEAGKRPLSSMSPTIVLEDGRPVAIAGASGGPRIISGTLQVLLSALVFGDDAGQAVTRPRLHHQWMPDQVRVELGWTEELTLEGLKARGHQLVRYKNPVGIVQAIVVKDGKITAASDPRKGGRPAGK
jgi:gamma-glutamyltranspeptidase/glutathione hydrolase